MRHDYHTRPDFTQLKIELERALDWISCHIWPLTVFDKRRCGRIGRRWVSNMAKLDCHALNVSYHGPNTEKAAPERLSEPRVKWQSTAALIALSNDRRPLSKRSTRLNAPSDVLARQSMAVCWIANDELKQVPPCPLRPCRDRLHLVAPVIVPLPTRCIASYDTAHPDVVNVRPWPYGGIPGLSLELAPELVQGGSEQERLFALEEAA